MQDIVPLFDTDFRFRFRRSSRVRIPSLAFYLFALFFCLISALVVIYRHIHNLHLHSFRHRSRYFPSLRSCIHNCSYPFPKRRTDHCRSASDANSALNCPGPAIEVQSGVGCASAMISAALRGKDMNSCECSCGGTENTCCGGETNEDEDCGCVGK